MLSRKLIFSFLAFFCVFYFFAGYSFIKNSSATYDETIHLSAGYSYIETGRYYINVMDHPPLAEILAALPLKFMNLNSFITHSYFRNFMPYSFADLFLYSNTEDAEKILNTARYFLFLLWSFLFVFIFFLWGKILLGEYWFLPLLLFFTNAVLLSNMPLVTTDIAPSFFYFASMFLGFLIVNPQNFKFKIFNNQYFLAIVSGILAGLAVSSKYSMFVLTPLWCFCLIFSSLFNNLKKMSVLAKLSFIHVVFSFLTVYAVFLGDFALFSQALSETFKRLDNGRSFFIFGFYGTQGFWWYFPAAFFLKNSLLISFSFLGGLFFLFKSWRKYFWILVPLCFYLLASFNTKVNIGIRHILPAMPFIILTASLFFAKFIEKYSKKAFFLFSFLFIVSFYNFSAVHPFYLTYFNEVIGHKNGYKYISDSNVDWGQDLKTLSKYLKKEGNPLIALSYFGSANPNYYGIRFKPALCISSYKMEPVIKENLCDGGKILLAVSATNLKGVYYPQKNIFSFLEGKAPVFNAGNSIFLYDLTNDKSSLKMLSQIFLFGNPDLDSSKCLADLAK